MVMNHCIAFCATHHSQLLFFSVGSLLDHVTTYQKTEANTNMSSFVYLTQQNGVTQRMIHEFIPTPNFMPFKSISLTDAFYSLNIRLIRDVVQRIGKFEAIQQYPAILSEAIAKAEDDDVCDCLEMLLENRAVLHQRPYRFGEMLQGNIKSLRAMILLSKYHTYWEHTHIFRDQVVILMQKRPCSPLVKELVRSVFDHKLRFIGNCYFADFADSIEFADAIIERASAECVNMTYVCVRIYKNAVDENNLELMNYMHHKYGDKLNTGHIDWIEQAFLTQPLTAERKQILATVLDHLQRSISTYHMLHWIDTVMYLVGETDTFSANTANVPDANHLRAMIVTAGTGNIIHERLVEFEKQFRLFRDSRKVLEDWLDHTPVWYGYFPGLIFDVTTQRKAISYLLTIAETES